MTTRAADGGVLVAWFAWFMAHIDQINNVIQFILLVTGIISTLLAGRYHWKKTKKDT